MGPIKRTLDFHMMATTATHKLGDISRGTPSLCRVYAEDGDACGGHDG